MSQTMSHQTSPNDDLVIGVDGGGTKSVAWVAALDHSTNGAVLGRGQSGPSNPRSVGFHAAQSAIADAIGNALIDAKRPKAPAAAAWFGVAGAGRQSEQGQLEAWARLEGKLAHRVRVSGDAEPILAAAAADHWGIALIGGTGSLAWGRNQQGVVARTGGWGYLIGDEGSAYAIAVAAIRAVMQAADGRRPNTSLLDSFLEYFGAASTADMIEMVYSPNMTRDRIAGSAQLVFLQRDDLVAAAIVTQAADDLATMVAALALQLNLPKSGYPLAMAGSLLLNQASFRRAIEDRLTAIAPCAITLVTEPVLGAVALARRLVNSND